MREKTSFKAWQVGEREKKEGQEGERMKERRKEGERNRDRDREKAALDFLNSSDNCVCQDLDSGVFALWNYLSWMLQGLCLPSASFCQCRLNQKRKEEWWIGHLVISFWLILTHSILSSLPVVSAHAWSIRLKFSQDFAYIFFQDMSCFKKSTLYRSTRNILHLSPSCLLSTPVSVVYTTHILTPHICTPTSPEYVRRKCPGRQLRKTVEGAVAGHLHISGQSWLWLLVSGRPQFKSHNMITSYTMSTTWDLS